MNLSLMSAFGWWCVFQKESSFLLSKLFYLHCHQKITSFSSGLLYDDDDDAALQQSRLSLWRHSSLKKYSQRDNLIRVFLVIVVNMHTWPHPLPSTSLPTLLSWLNTKYIFTHVLIHYCVSVIDQEHFYLYILYYNGRYKYLFTRIACNTRLIHKCRGLISVSVTFLIQSILNRRKKWGNF